MTMTVYAPALVTLALAIAIVFILGILYARAEPKITTVPVKPMSLAFMILPPVEYDHYYDGDLTIKFVDTVAELREYCKSDAPQLLACSTHNARSCIIMMVNDEVMRKAGWNTGLLLRHEIGHCNGWPGDHPGERPLVTTTHSVPWSERVTLSRVSRELPALKDDRK